MTSASLRIRDSGRWFPDRHKVATAALPNSPARLPRVGASEGCEGCSEAEAPFEGGASDGSRPLTPERYR